MNTIYNSTVDKQTGQRSKFALALNICKPLTGFLRVGYKNYTIKQTAFNAAMSYILANAITGEYPNYGIDMNKVLVSSGSLTGSLNAASTSANGFITLHWDDNSGSNNAKSSDNSMVVILNLSKDEAIYEISGRPREIGNHRIKTPADWNGDCVETFLAFITKDMKEVSDSSYVGFVIV